MAANQDLILSIVSEGYGFDIDEINQAITTLGSAAQKESVIAFLFETRHLKEKKKSQSGSQLQAGTSAASQSSSSGSKNNNNNRVDSISNGIKGIDINSGGQTLQQTSFDPSIENISGRSGTQAVKQRLLDQAKQRQKEKEELAKKNEEQRLKEMEEYKKKEFEQREHEKKVEQQRMRLQQKRNQSMKGSKSKKKANHSAFLQKQAKYIDEAQQVESDMKALDDTRAEMEEKINTPEQAIKAMERQYGKQEAGEKLMYVRRLLLNILNGPKDLNNALNRELRTFDYKNQRVLSNLITPFGPKIFLETVGFEERQLVKNKNDPTFRETHTYLLLPNKKFDIKRIEHAFECLNKSLEITSLNMQSIIYNECFKKEQISANSLFYGTWLLYNTIVNTRRDPDAENARSVDKVSFPTSCLESKTFTGLIKTLGFKEHALVTGAKYKLHAAVEDGKWSLKPFSAKGMRMLLVNSERLYDVCVLLLPKTTLGGAVYEFIRSNVVNVPKTKIDKFLKSTLNFVTKRLVEHLDHKKDMIDLKKIKEKCPNIMDSEGKENGIEKLLLLLDFEAPDVHGVMYSSEGTKKKIGMAQTVRKQRIFEFAVNYYTSVTAV